MNKRAIGITLLAATVLLVAGGIAAFSWQASQGTLGAPQRIGPPALVAPPGVQPQLWVLTKRREQRLLAEDSRHHFDLHAHDPVTAERRWSRRLLTMHYGGHNAGARILGIDRAVVWLFVNDQPVALSATDGQVLATGIALMEKNPGLAPMWPNSGRSFAFDHGLVMTTADALRWRINAGDWSASAYRPEDEEAFRRLQYMSSTWNGAYQTKDFLTRQQTTLDGRWVGLFSEREAADAADDGFGSNFKNPDRVHDEGASARRRFWLAGVGKTRRFSEGEHDRIQALTPLAGDAVYLQGGLLKSPGQREPMHPGADGGAIVVHRTRTDDAGTLVLTRVRPDFSPRWSATLPIGELTHRWELPGRLLLMGSGSFRDDHGMLRHEDHVVAVDLDDGRLRRWNINRESPQ